MRALTVASLVSSCTLIFVSGVSIGSRMGREAGEKSAAARAIEPRPAAEAESPHASLTQEPARRSGSERVPVDAAVPGHSERAEEILSHARARTEAAEQRAELLEEQLTNLSTMRFRVRQLEEQAALEPDGQIGLWAASLPAASVPDEHTRLVMASLLYDYPVVLQPDEGLWLAERIKAGDWYLWGASADEAIIQHLNPDRIAQEAPPAKLAALHEEWPSYFP